MACRSPTFSHSPSEGNEIRSPALEAWLPRLTEAEGASIMLASPERRYKPPEVPQKFINLAHQFSPGDLGIDVSELLQQPRLCKTICTTIVEKRAARRFDIHAWSDAHAWLDTLDYEDSHVTTLLRGIRRLALAVHLKQHEDLSMWIRQRQYRHTSGTLLYHRVTPLLARVEVCIIKWCRDLRPYSQQPSQSPPVEVNSMPGIDDFVDWICQRVPPGTEIVFVRPGHFANLEAVGQPSGLCAQSFLDPSVPAEIVRLSRKKRVDSFQSMTKEAQQQLEKARGQAQRDAKAPKSRVSSKARGSTSRGKATNDSKARTGRWDAFVSRISKPLKKPKLQRTQGLRIK